jgi:hypothetical protein
LNDAANSQVTSTPADLSVSSSFENAAVAKPVLPLSRRLMNMSPNGSASILLR